MVDKYRFSYEKGDSELYNDLKKKRISPFYGMEMADIFVFAAALSIMRDMTPLKLKGKDANIPISAMGKKTWLLNAIYVSRKGTHKALFDVEEVYSYAEQCANAGIKFLHKEVIERPGDIYLKIEKWIKNMK